MYQEILEKLQEVLQNLDQIPVRGLSTIKMANSIIILNELGQKIQEQMNEKVEESTDE